MRDFQVYLEDIIGAIKSIEDYTANMTYDDFAKDKKTIDAVIRNFEIVGEATKQLPEKIRSVITLSIGTTISVFAISVFAFECH